MTKTHITTPELLKRIVEEKAEHVLRHLLCLSTAAEPLILSDLPENISSTRELMERKEKYLLNRFCQIMPMDCG